MKSLNKDRTQATNKLYKFVNKITPLIQNVLEQGYEIKKDGSFYQKTNDQIKAIIDKHIDRNSQRCWIQSDKYTTYLKFDTWFKDGAHTCEYVADSKYLIHKDFSLMDDVYTSMCISPYLTEPIKTLTHKQVTKKHAKIQSLQKKIASLKDEISAQKKNSYTYLGN